MFGELALLVVTWLAFLSLVGALANGERRIDYDPAIDEFARFFAAALSAGLTAVMLEYGKPQFAVLGIILLAGLIIEYVKEHG